MTNPIRILTGDCRETLKTIPDGTVQTCVTSPPYWGLRDYGTATWEGGGVIQCKPCAEFFARFQCSKHLLECDCPKCQGLCECRECDHVADARKTKKFGNPAFNENRPSREETKTEGYYYRDTCGKCGAKRIDQQIGQEPTPEAFVQTMVEVFREVRRCLHESGTLWLNLGDSYAQNQAAVDRVTGYSPKQKTNGGTVSDRQRVPEGLKQKDLCMIPWRVAMALQADGWWLRSVICWHKKSCMPESATDRPTNSWEPIFLLAKSSRYFYDAEAVKEKAEYPNDKRRPLGSEGAWQIDGRKRGENGGGKAYDHDTSTRNQRNVWTLGPEPYSEAHFATFPTEIPRRAILAGTSARGCCPKCYAPWVQKTESTKTFESGSGKAGNRPNGKQDLSASETNSTPDIRMGPCVSTRTVGWEPGCDHFVEGSKMMPISCTVLDPFGGSGTTGQVALELARHAILCELNPEYTKLIERRTDVTPGLALH